MRMKRVLLATTALALLAGAQQAQAGDLYISVFGGANFLADDSGVFSSGTAAISFDNDTGFVLGGAVGTSLDKWAKGLRVELEASYRRNDLGGSWFTDADSPPVTDTSGGPIDGNMSTFAIMTNVWYDIDINSKIKPYVGGGVGWARVNADTALIYTFCNGGTCTGTNTNTNVENSGFAWQLGVGFNYEVAPDVDVGLGYRYFRGPSFHDTFFDGKASLHNENHAVQVNLTIGIN
ncbi:MAG: outer membrane beta-barrel protein [Alphaproteobacteria bacterium]|nr:outer membrane beta-barrel protein [Alphaproteobacteria bacterium]